MKDGVNVKKIIILLLCLVLVSCGTTNKSKSTTKDTLENSFFGVKKKVKEKLIYKKDKSIGIPTNHRLVKIKFHKHRLNGVHEAEPDTRNFHLFYN